MRRVLEGLMTAGHEVHGIFSEAGRKVCGLEAGLMLTGKPEIDETRVLEWLGDPAATRGTLRLYALNDFEAPIASGSFKTDGMVVVPCSMGALGRIAQGIGSNLLERAADVTVKERRRLLLVPREMPLSLIHLRNMVAAAESGIEIIPAMPGFYHNPRSVQDIVDSVAGRVLDRLGIDAPFLKRWTGPVPPEFTAWEDR
ncbi:MAG: UbiX family flavin prenyltransferase [Chloroflexi bacterium]|nr:UbiX family flavin prenyltransferase [Chloroflexota bacterium]